MVVLAGPRSNDPRSWSVLLGTGKRCDLRSQDIAFRSLASCAVTHQLLRQTRAGFSCASGSEADRGTLTAITPVIGEFGTRSEPKGVKLDTNQNTPPARPQPRMREHTEAVLPRIRAVPSPTTACDDSPTTTPLWPTFLLHVLAPDEKAALGKRSQKTPTASVDCSCCPRCLGFFGNGPRLPPCCIRFFEMFSHTVLDTALSWRRPLS